ncbi:SAM and PH domain-containing protein [Phyllosticta citribraziliensis]|uniref:SAM and PH domain-containing protein n=1 Tax=Phyllosticta citribraziliensis TaxID=989973 RepID=A0ABR1LEZ4_9PEZI
MEVQTPITPLESGVEMFQRGKLQPFFAMRSDKPRPVSEATEIFDTDFEDDSSEFEEESQKYGYESSESRKSQTTISTYDEVPTPHSHRQAYFELSQQDSKTVEGPRGPHLFRSSLSSAEFNYEYALQMSPLLPRSSMPRAETAFRAEPSFRSETAFRTVPAQQPSFSSSCDPWATEEPEEEDPNDVRFWSAQQVVSWMYTLGFEESIVEKFEKHDITGAVLLDMQFEDLKELEISSFGKRHQLWNHIDALRGNEGRISPVPTPFQDADRPCTRLTRSRSTRERSTNLERSRSCAHRNDCDDNDGGMTPVSPGGQKRRRGRKHRQASDDVITPAESVSIVAIEQLLPKPHKCAKGERCHKWRKQQRLFQRIQEEHGFPISPEKGGQIFIAGDPGNAGTAGKVVENVYRPQSDALPSVVASSDLMGPGQLPDISYPLEEAALRGVQSRDPQENVKQFLNFQHVDPPHMQQFPEDQPTTPPYEMFPPLHFPEQSAGPHANLKNLPRLNIPRSASAQPYAQPQQIHPAEYITTMSPCRTATNASPGIYRFGTPASEMDVPVTTVQVGPIPRDVSQSVPPSMQFRDPVQRSASRPVDWRRPSYTLPVVTEGEVLSPKSEDSVTLHDSASGRTAVASNHKPSMDSSADSIKDFKTHLLAQAQQGQGNSLPGVNHAGWMKKRRTKLLRHEWQEHHFRLTGTRLAMHANEMPDTRALDTIDVDEYAVGCSSLASNKLAAKLKGLKLASSSSKNSDGSSTAPNNAAFTFQLVPTGPSGEGERSVMRKAVAGGKTHHFAVKTRDERIDWMRELMLAKALKAKGEGYEVEVNGNAI